MLPFTHAISCLTTSNLPWFMDLPFQVPMQYCSLQHTTLLLSPVTTTTGCCFCFGSAPSFFLELFLHWSQVAYWAPTDLGSSSFSVLSFCLFILFMGFSRLEYWRGLPFPSPMNHILIDLSHDLTVLGGSTGHGLDTKLHLVIVSSLASLNCKFLRLWFWMTFLVCNNVGYFIKMSTNSDFSDYFLMIRPKLQVLRSKTTKVGIKGKYNQ